MPYLSLRMNPGRRLSSFPDYSIASKEAKTKNKGFLLVEVLVAMSLLVFSIIYVSKALRQFVNYTIALNLAQEKFFELETEGPTAQMSESDSKFPDNADFSCDSTISRLENLELNNATLDIKWQEGKRNGNLEMVCYLPIQKE